MAGEAAMGLVSASVFLEDLTDGTWMQVNPAETYHPASMIKVVTLITYMRMAEADPKLLDKQFQVNTLKDIPVPTQSFVSKTIEPGRSYTIRELLHSMIAYSDNYATWMLNSQIDLEAFRKVFTELGLARPNVADRDFRMTVMAYSKFLKVLYNASYLTIPASEYATSLLCECDFRDGIMKELPANVRVAHKFGESGSHNLHELHETAIVYLNNRAYLLTIMTRGKEITKLTGTLSHISKAVYDFMSARDQAGVVTGESVFAFAR
jgi:beta-lactamase class A